MIPQQLFSQCEASFVHSDLASHLVLPCFFKRLYYLPNPSLSAHLFPHVSPWTSKCPSTIASQELQVSVFMCVCVVITVFFRPNFKNRVLKFKTLHTISPTTHTICRTPWNPCKNLMHIYKKHHPACQACLCLNQVNSPVFNLWRLYLSVIRSL